jgi:hypothetical protein
MAPYGPARRQPFGVSERAAVVTGNPLAARLTCGSVPGSVARWPMVDKVKKIWLDGEFIDWDARTSTS